MDQYIAGLNRKRLAAGVLFRDTIGRTLLVEPSYKPNWEIPGGAVDTDESPWAAAQREIAEELGWHRPVGRLLVIDYVRPQDSRPEGVIFVFDGGTVDEKDLATITLDQSELLSAGFYTLIEARKRVKPLLADRLASVLHAAAHSAPALCEQGHRIA